MVHTVGWRVASPEAVDFWEGRLADEGIAGERYEDGAFAFRDPEGLRHALIPGESPDEPLIADHPEVPKEFALQGFHGVRAYAHDPEQSRSFLEETLGERLSLPPNYEHLRDRLEGVLTPLPDLSALRAGK